MGVRRWIVGWTSALLLPVHGLVGAAAAPPPEPVRIAIVGDSITHGSSGDWTWRYFLGRQLSAAGVPYDFVGGRDDVHDLSTDDWDATTSPTGAQAYADPEFDTDHQALWGDSVVLTRNPIPEFMQEHRPDVVIHALGFSDLTWCNRTPDQLLADVRAQVDRARTENSEVALVLAQVMVDTEHWSRFSFAEFNDLLAQVAPTWSEPASPVVVVTVPDDFRALADDGGGDTWDGTHPTPPVR